MSITSKLQYLLGTKDYIRQCIQQKGVSVPASNTFRQYGDRILEIEGSGGSETPEMNLQEGTATPTGKTFDMTPSIGYDGFSKVTVLGDSNLKAENIAEGITIYGITGTLAPQPVVGGLIPDAYKGFFDQARLLYPGDYEHLMILESDEAVAFGFMLSGFNVESYNTESTEFTASRWVYVAYNKSKGEWKIEDWTTGTSNGNSYTKNIRYSDVYIYYGNTVIYPYVINPNPGFEHTEFEFIVEIPTDIAGVELGLYHAGAGVTINYGDGTGDVELRNISGTSTNYTESHTFESAGTYTVHISGPLTHFYSSGTGEANRILPQFIKKVTLPLPSSLTYAAGLFGKANYDIDIPSNLFMYATRVTDLTSFFHNAKSLTKIPAELFFPLMSLSVVSSMFQECTSLTEIPAGLFINNPMITTAKEFARRAIRLPQIPQSLFGNSPLLNTIESGFLQCSSVQVIPENMFADGTVSLNTSGTFYSCSTVATAPTNIFDGVEKLTNLTNTFRGCSAMTGDLPELWNRADAVAAPHTSCFNGCAKAANYSDVPSGWK